MLTTQSAQAFSAARRQAFIEEWLSFFTGRPTDLLSFEEVRQNLHLDNSAYKGLHEVELDKIVGSTGRYRDFTRTFLPKNDATQQRWRQIDAIAESQGFPPVELFQVGDVYFVRDGNHRVSVARQNKAKTIEAYVIEYKTPVPINNEDELDDILLKMERADFLDETNLDAIRPDHNIRFTEPGRYRIVKEHITFHKYLKETECGCEIAYETAVASWYDNVYLPLLELIREQQILKQFPDRTEADLYAWIVLHRAALEEETKTMGYVSTEDIVHNLKVARGTNPFNRLIGLFGHRADLENIPLKVEQARFLEETQLDRIRPDHGIEFTEPGCYRLASEHIAVHKYLKETEYSREIPYQEAVASWYDTVYLPVVNLIRERRILSYFPGNSKADLYIWLVSRRAVLEEQKHTLGQVSNEKVLETLEREMGNGSLSRLIHYLRHRFVS